MIKTICKTSQPGILDFGEAEVEKERAPEGLHECGIPVEVGSAIYYHSGNYF